MPIIIHFVLSAWILEAMSEKFSSPRATFSFSRLSGMVNQSAPGLVSGQREAKHWTKRRSREIVSGALCKE